MIFLKDQNKLNSTILKVAEQHNNKRTTLKYQKQLNNIKLIIITFILHAAKIHHARPLPLRNLRLPLESKHAWHLKVRNSRTFSDCPAWLLSVIHTSSGGSSTFFHDAPFGLPSSNKGPFGSHGTHRHWPRYYLYCWQVYRSTPELACVLPGA